MENLHSTVQEIKKLLEKKGMWFDYLEHSPVRTSEEAAKVRPDYSLSQGAKALIVRIKKYGGEKFYAMLVVPGNLKFDMKKTKALFEAKDIRFASEEEVAEITRGIKLGGVPPFGNLFGLSVWADKKVVDNDKIVFNAGDKRASIAITTKDYMTLVNPTVVDIT